MSATDELRALLDECGVEHYDGTETTLWGYEPTGESTGVYRFAADETSGGRIVVRMLSTAPAQAVEATLGRGECKNNSISGNFFCSECKCFLCLEDSEYEPTMWVHAVSSAPRYCPNCGRKVMDE